MHHINTIDENNYDNDDLITFQLDSKKIDLYYSQLTKYSKRIRDKYLFSDVLNCFVQEIHKFQEETQISQESIVCFFNLLQQNYNIKENFNLTYMQCVDLLKIAKYLEVRKLSFKINEYIKTHDIDVNFIIQMIEYEVKTRKKAEEFPIGINGNMENLLSSKIDECFSNEKFAELPISIIYRVVKKSFDEGKNINDKLFNLIKKSISKFCVLFQFLNIQKLSKDRLSELCDMYCKSDETSQQYFDYIKCNLIMIKEMNEQLVLISRKSDEQNYNLKELQKQFSDSEKVKDEQNKKMKELEAQINQLKTKLIGTQEENQNLQRKLKAEHSIKGEIVASVKKNLIVSARIKLDTKNSLDTIKSKYIISTSDAEMLTSELYEKGEPITSTEMNTIDFICRSGRYFVRCLIYDKGGNFKELVSNEVTISGDSLTFGYEGEPAKISLNKGQYKLEVWGAKGGDSTGKGGNERKNSTPVKGGLGGYSCGIVRLNENDTVYVYVGGEGQPGNPSDGSTAKGGFPDGGGTKTGHSGSYTTVPATGGGSTSIRIGNDTIYGRVIVAGGGGGASGDNAWISSGGFGGGQIGGSCYYMKELQSQGGGTQSGSTQGLGEGDDRHGDPGRFGEGATGKYRKGCDSGGGGGGGWYGGGSGGYGACNRCSSGGGGSGWIFTESSFKKWQSEDSTNADKFKLDKSYYLTNAITVSGDKEFPRPDGNGNERGHSGNGYAKITPI